MISSLWQLFLYFSSNLRVTDCRESYGITFCIMEVEVFQYLWFWFTRSNQIIFHLKVVQDKPYPPFTRKGEKMSREEENWLVTLFRSMCSCKGVDCSNEFSKSVMPPRNNPGMGTPFYNGSDRTLRKSYRAPRFIESASGPSWNVN